MPRPFKTKFNLVKSQQLHTRSVQKLWLNRELLSRPGALEEKRTEKRSQRLSKILKVERKLFSPSLRGERASFINTFSIKSYSRIFA